MGRHVDRKEEEPNTRWVEVAEDEREVAGSPRRSTQRSTGRGGIVAAGEPVRRCGERPNEGLSLLRPSHYTGVEEGRGKEGVAKLQLFFFGPKPAGSEPEDR